MDSEGSIRTKIGGLVEQVLEDYGTYVAFLVVGIIIGWYLKVLLSDKKYHALVKQLLDEKDQRIADLNTMVSERLNKVVVNEEGKSFFRKIKQYFKKGGKNR